MGNEPDDLAPPSGAAGGAPKRIVCEFCECRLASSGEVLSRSARAKKLLDLDEKADEQAAELDRLRAEVASLEQQLATAKQENEAAKKATGIRW